MRRSKTQRPLTKKLVGCTIGFLRKARKGKLSGTLLRRQENAKNVNLDALPFQGLLVEVGYRTDNGIDRWVLVENKTVEKFFLFIVPNG